MTVVDKKKRVLDFIKRQHVAVLATVDGVRRVPECAVVEFSETDNLEIIFDTFSSYRKYGNLQTNQRVALVIGCEDDVTVQYEGVAREVTGDELKRCQKIHTAKLPGAKKFTTMEDIRFFRITPVWIRYVNVSLDPWEVFELSL